MLWERHVLSFIEHLLGEIQGAQVFSKLDANSGFYQIPLEDKSQALTTFITPLGRYCYRRLQFRISSAPEYFQKRMTEILVGLQETICMMDDILVYGANEEEHSQCLYAVLNHLQQAGITLNQSKCQFNLRRCFSVAT